ncbi:hypothetical protein [Streptomyces sp. SAS_272]|uniref:hypothetical protein n=1 Tax=Streptomyces sp. SAS_272 TaxID=3412747 RepID=UPI00403C74C3
MTVFDTYGTNTYTAREPSALLADHFGVAFTERESFYLGIVPQFGEEFFVSGGYMLWIEALCVTARGTGHLAPFPVPCRMISAGPKGQSGADDGQAAAPETRLNPLCFQGGSSA